MYCLMLLSSRRWVCAFLGSVRGRISEFRDAHKVKKNTYGAEQPFDPIVYGYAPGEPPSPSPSIARRRTPAAFSWGSFFLRRSPTHPHQTDWSFIAGRGRTTIGGMARLPRILLLIVITAPGTAPNTSRT